MNGAPGPSRPPQDGAGGRRRFRWAWWLLAYASLGLGIIGAFLPVMPTTVFVLIAAWAAARGSDRLHAWLHGHPRFGKVIGDWEAEGAVSRRAKWMATWAMLASALVLVAVMQWGAGHRWWMFAVPIACMATVGLWLWRRPEPRDPGPPDR